MSCVSNERFHSDTNSREIELWQLPSASKPRTSGEVEANWRATVIRCCSNSNFLRCLKLWQKLSYRANSRNGRDTPDRLRGIKRSCSHSQDRCLSRIVSSRRFSWSKWRCLKAGALAGRHDLHFSQRCVPTSARSLALAHSTSASK